ncbi:unnamed protein product [Acanthocheilonema viteae]|uniref:Uncharacterized protein n=1 Tax=Acanthocheilonema viteae TaxID=6277 RepID=A0A498SDZ5_ACAVI|nr:unnamed protein product [Acanthocheilonema viteae]
MNSNSKFHLEDQLSTASTSPMNETELDFEPVVGDLSDITTTSAVVPITTKQLMTQTGEDVYDVITASPSGSSDGSSNEFVKVEHSDVQQNVELTGNPLSFKMLQMHDDADNEKRGTDRKYPVGNIMDREFVSEEPYSGILPRAEEFAEFAAEKVSDITKAGAGKVMDATNKAVNDAKVAGESLDDTIHLFGDKLKETTRQAGDMGHQAVEAAKDTTSNMLSGIDMSEKTRSIGADVAHSLDEGANKAMDTFKEEFDDVSHGILDTAHLATSTLKNTLQEAGDVLKDAAPQLVHSAEDSLSDLNNKIKNSDLYARIETSGAIKPRQEDLIGLTDEINSASERDAGYRSIFQQSTGGTHQDVDYPSGKWNLDWRQYANEETGIGAHHSDFDVKAVHSAENAIHDEIVDVHDQVDSMIAKMSVAGAPQHDDSSAEESMFDRKGPLTIPQQTPDDMIQFEHGFDSSKQSGFEVSPRPPTPPKELDDEDVKPTTIDLGQTAGRLLVTGEHRSSILKNSTQGARFNFKDMDARSVYCIWHTPNNDAMLDCLHDMLFLESVLHIVGEMRLKLGSIQKE